jgi:hypothetical protein
MILNDANRNYKCPSIFNIERAVFRLKNRVLIRGFDIKLYTIITIYSLLHIAHVIEPLAAIALPARYY